jgi:2,4-dienoyl-CoA reductase-like NADH-dependent reductase (Old Yellow Enzyme family)
MPIDLFEPYTIGKLQLKNRFVRSATWDAMSNEDGSVSEKSVELYRVLGQGGVGLIVSGHIFIELEGRAGFGQYGIHNNDMIPGLKKMTEVSTKSGAKIAAQLAHSGLFRLEREELAVAVSEIPQVKRLQHEMTGSEIEELITKYADAARRAAEAGFDAVQLHAAHGYLLSQFLSPLYNHRSDKWGGSAAGRRNFHIEVLKRIKKELGSSYPVFIKLGVKDDKEGGLQLAEGLATAMELEKAGIDTVEVSLGFGTAIRNVFNQDVDQAYFRDLAAAVKQKVKVPVMAVGGIRSLATANAIVNCGESDMISMSRPFIRQPDLISKWKKDFSARAECISCGKCFGNAIKHSQLICRDKEQNRAK